MNQVEIQAMIKLLEDPDEEVYKTVFDHLLSQGAGIVPELEKAWGNASDELYQTRLEDLIQAIHLNSTENEMNTWLKEDAIDILRGAHLVARLQYPDLELTGITEPIEKIRNEIWIELNDNLTALEKVKIINHFLFDVHKFSKNSANPSNPQNSYLNQVLDTKKGNPYSLAIIYLAISHRLGIPVYGVDLPRNMIMAYLDVSKFIPGLDYKNENILFYINPYNKGAVLGRKEIEYYLQQIHTKPEKSHFNPCPNRIIIKRLISELIGSYQNLGYQDKIRQMERMNRLFQDE